MATLDIRNKQKEAITDIVFCDIYKDTINDWTKGVSGGGEFLELKITHDRIDYNDIDNFILALKKAKELWNK